MTLITNIDGTNREMTEAEKAEYIAWQTEKQTKIAETEQAKASKQALKISTLQKLGLTVDEVNALLS